MMGPKVLVMGVAGRAKSTLAAELARELAATLIEGDDRQQSPGQDDPWLGRLGDLLAAELGPAVLACPALKRRSRERLRTAVPALRTVYVDRVASRVDALEAPTGEPAVLTLAAHQPLTAQVQTVLQWLNHGGAAAAL